MKSPGITVKPIKANNRSPQAAAQDLMKFTSMMSGFLIHKGLVKLEMAGKLLLPHLMNERLAVGDAKGCRY